MQKNLAMHRKLNMGTTNADSRIKWCDVYRGILIVLVVLGHSTSLFNGWIYQFHMAAFFFISGFVERMKESLGDFIVKRACVLIVPYYGMNLLGILLFWGFDKIGILQKISTVAYPDRFWDALKGLFNNTVVYCDWLGAMWFLPVLFIASIITWIIVHLFKRERDILLITVLLFLYCMYTKTSQNLFFLRLAGMAQLFVICGYLFRHKIEGKTVTLIYVLMGTLLMAFIWIINRHMGLRGKVDWPSAQFNGWSDMILPFPGILLTMGISLLITESSQLKKFFMFLGKNSMGIMCFHFIGFKATYAILIMLGRMKAEDFHLLVPQGISISWELVLLLIISILFSISLCQFRWGGIITGAKGKQVSNFILSTKFVRNVKLWIYSFEHRIFKIVKSCRNWCRDTKNKILVFGIAIVIFVLIISIKLWVYSQPILVDFPSHSRRIDFETGWLPQTKEEKYRWVEKRSSFTVFLIHQDTLTLEGYIPEDVKDITYFKIIVNDKEVFSTEVKNNSLLDIQKLDLSEWVRPFSINTFEIEMDGTKIPNCSDMDQRVMSAYINRMELY